jgi:hypothetical protein
VSVAVILWCNGCRKERVPLDRDGAQRVLVEREARAAARQQALGYIIQPVGREL